MRLLTVGDSFTWGEELVNKNSAWPNLVADELNFKLTNMAKPGSGNTRMVRYVVENLSNFDIVIVGWSHFARTELADENGFYDLWPGCSTLPHKEYSPWRKTVIQYYTEHHNDEYLYTQYLINVIMLQKYLEENNKKYLMLDSFGNNTRRNHALVDQVNQTRFLGWPSETMMEWTYGCPQGPGGHFLEEGHRRVAEKINEHIRRIGWIS